MSNLSVERLKDFERDPLNNFLTRSEMMEAVKELLALREAQKGDQVPFGYVEHRAAVKVVKGETQFAALTMEPKGDKCLPLFTTPQKPVALPGIDADVIRDANRYRFLRDEDAWGEDSDSWDCDTRTGLISSENLMGGLSPDHFDDAIDARMAASDIPFFNPVMATNSPVGYIPKGWAKRYLNGVNTGCWIYGEKSHSDDEPLFLGCGVKVVDAIKLPGPYFGDRNCLDKREVIAAIEAAGGIVKDGE